LRAASNLSLVTLNLSLVTLNLSLVTLNLSSVTLNSFQGLTVLRQLMEKLRC
jgi:hypothetical protein